MAEPRYRVEKREHHGGGLFELEITTTWEVVDVRTGAVVRSFREEYDAHYDGVGWADGVSSGVADVSLGDDQRSVVVRHADGRVETVALEEADGGQG